MIGFRYPRVLRVGAALGMVMGLAAAGFMPSAAKAQGYYHDGQPYGYRHAYPYGGYGPQYGAVSGYYPGPYYAPQPYQDAPAVVYVQPRLRYAAPVRRIVHRVAVHPVTVTHASCSCALPHAAKPVALVRPAAPIPAAQPPIARAPIAAAPTPAVQAPPAEMYEPRPSAGD